RASGMMNFREAIVTSRQVMGMLFFAIQAFLCVLCAFAVNYFRLLMTPNRGEPIEQFATQ
ncbi:MAG: hypothetical protein ABR544_06665, partial [Gammaproteobacteria bacterium]